MINILTKKFLIPALTLVVSSGIVLGATSVLAQDSNTSPMNSLVQKLAQRFNLNESDVQAVFDEHHSEMHAQMKLRFEDHLSGLVTEGKITEAQKEAIFAKMEELKANRETLKEEFSSMSAEERKAKMQEKRAELEAWAQEQGIDLSITGPLMFGHHKGFGWGRHVMM